MSIQSDTRGYLLVTSNAPGDQYETVAASQTDQVLGATGAVGDFLDRVLIIPATTAAGVVQIQDGSDTAITIFTGGGTTALTILTPVSIDIRAASRTGAWSITTGANVSVIAFGKFT